MFGLRQDSLLFYCPPPFKELQFELNWSCVPVTSNTIFFFLFDVLNSLICILQALFTRDDDTSDEEEEEDEAEAPDIIGADELQGGGVSEIPGSKQR